MANAKELTLQVGVQDKEFSVLTPTEDQQVIEVEELTLVHVNIGESFQFPLKVSFYRKVPILKGCTVEEYCHFYGETCDTLYLPPGKYEYEVCDDGAAKYTPNGIHEVSLILEPVSDKYVLAEKLNANC